VLKRKLYTHVATESTSVYWKPIVTLLEDEDIEFLVVNAQHIKPVPGRKTDIFFPFVLLIGSHYPSVFAFTSASAI
jgi:hypothetical protein